MGLQPAAVRNVEHQIDTLFSERCSPRDFTDAMGGFGKDRTRAALNIPDDFAIEVIVAIGKRGESRPFPESLRSREVPSNRLPLNALVLEGGFPG